jgi:hypothetical protein
MNPLQGFREIFLIIPNKSESPTGIPGNISDYS